ncbi:hypothetical protein ABZW96_17885 [Nocardia sp. NPDC004168]|uniref:hypothetical protein n=1 Tax=Nocardia TaxID=1817 RepID=UPI0033A3D0AB
MAHNTQTVPLSVIGWQGHGFFRLPDGPDFRDITVTWSFSQLHQWSQFGQLYARDRREIHLCARKFL